MKMASRMNLPRLALMAALATLLSGCYAHGGGPYITHYGGGYAYQGAYRQAPSSHAPSGHAPSGHAPSGHAPSGHAYDEQRHHKPRLHRKERRHRSAAREPGRRPEPTHRLERSGQPRHDPGAQAPRRGARGSTDRKAEPQPGPAEGYGRRDEWRPGPTARDEGPRPGAEGGAR